MAEKKAKKAKVDLNTLLAGTFLEEILKTKGKGSRSPVDEKNGGEVVIGKMTDLELRLNALNNEYGKIGGILQAKLQYEDIPEDKVEETTIQVMNISARQEIYNKLMWQILRERHPVANEHTIGIRENEQVVMFKNRKMRHRCIEIGKGGSDELNDLLGGIFDR